jgi:hypothetical protein
MKTLPKYFVIKWSEDPRWKEYIRWLNKTYLTALAGSDENSYYGYAGSKIELDMYYNRLNGFQNRVKELTLDEFFYIIDQEMKITVKKSALKEIHFVACPTWKEKIEKLTLRNPFGETIELTQSEIDEMFNSATKEQKPVLESIFGKQTKEIDLSSGTVDGKELFNKNSGDSMISVRNYCEYQHKAFILSNQYNWEMRVDSDGFLCLIPTRK